MNRPLLILSIVAADCAIKAGLRLKTFTTPVASLIRLVTAANHANLVKASHA
jgi:hypothetical protein